ncbi:MAG: phosphatidate cytidylyltransferase [Desulfobulbaceae bacterium]|nr:phosphatidate cytidylyltransferase [Desulfobulbaceae bacterium]MCK5543941.1 phosphatidate cytidylyltransferase [Desulfobulbaceae bacterium]
MIRIITGVTAVISWLSLLFYGSFYLFWFIICVIGGIGLYEYFKMIFVDRQAGFRPFGVFIGLVPILASFYGSPEALAAGLFVSLLLMFGFVMVRYSAMTNHFEVMAGMGFGVFYIGFCAAHLPLIMAMPHGVYWLLILTAVTAASDSGAYYAGTFFGRTKLCPVVSPKKTLEGFAGGLVAAVIAVYVISTFFPWDVDKLKMTGLAVPLCCLGVFGDLAESMIKRSTGIKDSGTILPGHGGVLDRVDSILLTCPALFYLIYMGWV